MLETLSTDLPISFSRRTQIRQPNTPKPIQKQSKSTKNEQPASQSTNQPTCCLRWRGWWCEPWWRRRCRHKGSLCCPNMIVVLPQEDRCVATRGSLCCHKRIVVLPQEDRCVATRGTFSETCFAHNSAHRILLETLSTDLVISSSRRSQIRQPNTPKPKQKPQKNTTKNTQKNTTAFNRSRWTASGWNCAHIVAFTLASRPFADDDDSGDPAATQHPRDPALPPPGYARHDTSDY